MWLVWKAYFWLINRAIRRGDNSTALRLAKQYARLNSDDPVGWVTWIRESVARETSSWPWDDATANYVVPTGALQESEELLRQLLRKNQESFALRLQLADVLIKRANHEALVEKAEEASSLLAELLAKRPNSPEVLYALAEIAFHQRDWDELWRLIEAAREGLSYEEDPALFQRVITLLTFVPGEGRQQARGMLQEALEIDPARAKYLSLLALLLEDDDPTQAAKYLEQARKLEPDLPWDEDLQRERALLARWGPEWWAKDHE